jgi:hypothetical protein
MFDLVDLAPFSAEEFDFTTGQLPTGVEAVGEGVELKPGKGGETYLVMRKGTYLRPDFGRGVRRRSLKYWEDVGRRWKMLEDVGRRWKMWEDVGRRWKMLEDVGKEKSEATLNNQDMLGNEQTKGFKHQNLC